MSDELQQPQLSDADTAMLDARKAGRQARSTASGLRTTAEIIQGMGGALQTIHNIRMQKDDRFQRNKRQEMTNEWIETNVVGRDPATGDINLDLILDPGDVANAFDEWWDDTLTPTVYDGMRTRDGRMLIEDTYGNLKSQMSLKYSELAMTSA